MRRDPNNSPYSNRHPFYRGSLISHIDFNKAITTNLVFRISLCSEVEMACFKSLFLLCTLASLVHSQCNKERARGLFKRSVYDFSVELLSRIVIDTDGHFVASTLSPWTLLATISLGATDNTLAEIQQVAHLHKLRCFNNRYLELVKDVSVEPLIRSSSIFIDQTLGLKEHFQRIITDTNICNITPLDFSDFNVAASQINSYVRSATRGVIEDIVTPADLEGAFLIMTDALYFKGSWTFPFSPEDTEYSTFYDSHKNPTGDVNLMFSRNSFNITNVDLIQAKVLEMPYGNDGKYSMLLFLPHEGVTVHNVIDSLRKISLTSIFNRFKMSDPSEVDVQVPRFKISSDLDNLKELLTDMGLRETFDRNANFPRMSDYSVYVSSFIQKASIEVTEEGTEAGAASSLGFTSRNFQLIDDFNANKPFVYMVVDRANEVPIFSGAYSKPSIY
ncbi:hypothetical protein ACJJTC_004255 [Scirpophaga incertulas]